MSAGYVPFNALPHSAHSFLVDRAGIGGRVLELGCSSGYVSRRLVARGNAVVGVDGDPAAAEAARAVCERVVVGDLETMDLPGGPGEYDAVVLGDVLEHLRNPREVLARLRPLVRPDGRVVVSTPNVANFSLRLRLLAGRWNYAERGLMDRTHVHFFTRATLEDALRAAGFAVVEVDGSVPSVVRGRAARSVAHALVRARPSLLAHQLLVVARAA